MVFYDLCISVSSTITSWESGVKSLAKLCYELRSWNCKRPTFVFAIHPVTLHLHNHLHTSEVSILV